MPPKTLTAVHFLIKGFCGVKVINVKKVLQMLKQK